VGSLLCGSRDFIHAARRVRKMLGGGMRQVGVLAAAGLIALRKGPAHLPQDHENAARLGRTVSELPGIDFDLETVKTNIVLFYPRTMPALEFVGRLKDAGILAVPMSADTVRFVTHRDVSPAQIDQAIERIRKMAG